ncbi:isoprenylcysteine carboxylmethyltransferase family protein [Methylopila sp. 73B]|uniref:isoprenylcysteine carboxyl methyltransferase family protein n=1 Tax=Methylopila sp. 73B TaxID=1120792 RepID=UPI000360D4CA|nr:isoprenylcysteine carboxylmethyltransferase family protein [Methylopila sp. 73B]
MSGAVLLLLFVTASRLGELVLSARNVAGLKARSAIEAGASHYPAMVALHTSWLAGLWWLGRDATVSPGWLAAFGALQVLRVWTLATLGRRWTTRILVIPGETLVRRGPYRFVAHPNYVVVAGEIAVLPLVFGLPVFAFVFSLLNAGMLAVRIRAEEAALKRHAAP